MHKIYFGIWNFSIRLNEISTFKKTSIFLFLNIVLWIFAGILIYLIYSMLPIVRFSLADMMTTAGYSGTIMGFFGAVIYILRNTEPEDL